MTHLRVWLLILSCFVSSQGGWCGSIYVPSAGSHSSGCQVTPYAGRDYCMFTFLQGSALTLPTYFLDQGHSITIVGQSPGTGDTKRLSHVWLSGLDRPITACSRGSHGRVERGSFSIWTRERFARERAVNLSHSQNCGRYTVYTVHTLFKNMCI